VSDIVHFFLVQLYCSIKVYCSYSNVKQRKYTCIRVQSVRLLKKSYTLKGGARHQFIDRG